MADLSLQQIADRLNGVFAREQRTLIFWYDELAEFAGEVDTLSLEHAEILHLAPDNQFQIKYILERQNPHTNYLIYAPFPKPAPAENHLEDTLLYSVRFSADRASLICADLNIPERCRPVLEQYRAFFADGELRQRFYALEVEAWDEETIQIGLLSVLCRCRICAFDGVLQQVLREEAEGTSACLQEFEQYALTDVFWRLCEKYYGYVDAHPSAGRLTLTLFATCMSRYLRDGIPASWEQFISAKTGSVLALTDSLLHNSTFPFDRLSESAGQKLQLDRVLKDADPADLLNCELSAAADRRLLNWMTDRLLDEDTGATLGGLDISAVCRKRMRLHFGQQYAHAWQMILYAAGVIAAADYTCPDDFEEIVERYVTEDFRIDQCYRGFYYHLDQMENAESLETLRSLVEAVYSNEYLARLLPAWNTDYRPVLDGLQRQTHFYANRISTARDQVIVIFSDALRYEVGEELCRRLQDDPRCSSVKLEPMRSTLPSYTQLGMAAMLPHRSLTMTEDIKVLVDGKPCDTLAGRQAVLQRYAPEGICVQFDDLKGKNQKELRALLNGRQVVYVYHNQIDARGDKANTEDEVFAACSEAIDEIAALIRRLCTSANKRHFIVTADHGFLYRREKLPESAKISGISAQQNARENRRFLISAQPLQGTGIGHIRLGDTLENEDSRAVSFPIGPEIFKVAGGGQNFVHGGSSPQEMLIPVLDIHMDKAHVEVHAAQIQLISSLTRITNLRLNLEVVQTEAVCDTVRAAVYHLYFITESGEKISSVSVCSADSRETETAKRIFRQNFTLKEQEYDRGRRYYLVAVEQQSGTEVLRQEVTIDIAFAGDYGFF